MENLKVSIGGTLKRIGFFSQAFKGIRVRILLLLILFYPFFFTIHNQKVFGKTTDIFAVIHGLIAVVTEKIQCCGFIDICKGELIFLIDVLFGRTGEANEGVGLLLLHLWLMLLILSNGISKNACWYLVFLFNYSGR